MLLSVLLLVGALLREWLELGPRGAVGVFQVLSEPAILVGCVLALELVGRWIPRLALARLGERFQFALFVAALVLVDVELLAIIVFGTRFVRIMTVDVG